jgi:hypothetical protein
VPIERVGDRFIKQICDECHNKRLRKDIIMIIKAKMMIERGHDYDNESKMIDTVIKCFYCGQNHETSECHAMNKMKEEDEYWALIYTDL